MKLNKKLLLSLGSVASAALPIATVVSCGSELVKDADGNVLMSYESSSKTVYFNLNKDKSEQIDTSSVQLKQFLPAFKQYSDGSAETAKLTREDLIKMNDAFQKVTDPRFSNIDRLKNGDEVHVIITGQLQKETAYVLHSDEGFAQRPFVKINFSMEIDYIYNDHSQITYPLMSSSGTNGRLDSTHPDQRDKERVKVRSNFLDNLIEGFHGYNLTVNKNRDINYFFPKEGYHNAPSTSTNKDEYINDTFDIKSLKSAIVNADPSISRNVLSGIPRNYETFVKLPKVDLTKALIQGPTQSELIGAHRIEVSGNAADGFNIVVPHTTLPSATTKVTNYIKSLSSANTLPGFFKTVDSTDIEWKDNVAYSTSTADSTATVKIKGKDWKGQDKEATYQVHVKALQS